MPGFTRVNPLGEGAVRGPARILVAASTIAFPANINAIVNLAPATGGISGVYAAAVQTVTISGTPTGGTFTLAFNGVQTAPIPWNATAIQMQTALNNLAGIAQQGGVTVALATSVYTITFGVSGAQQLITVPPQGLQ